MSAGYVPPTHVILPLPYRTIRMLRSYMQTVAEGESMSFKVLGNKLFQFHAEA